MHELSVARSILTMIRTLPEMADGPTVKRIHVRLGESSGIVPDSLEFAFQAIVAGTDFSGAALCIEHVPFRVHCHTCGQDSGNAAGFSFCGHCDGSDVEVVSGTELEVVSVETEDCDEHHYH